MVFDDGNSKAQVIKYQQYIPQLQTKLDETRDDKIFLILCKINSYLERETQSVVHDCIMFMMK